MVNIQGLGPLPGTIDPQNIDGSKHLGSVANILQDYIKNLTISHTIQKNSPGPKNDPGKPTLPAPETGVNTDLAQLLLKLRTETDEKQLKAAVEFIKTNKSRLEGKHKERVKKILDAAKKAENAAKAGKAGKVFGWVCLAVTVVAAVAACVATGGLAVGPCIGALMSIGMMVMQETGGMDKIMELSTDMFKAMGFGEPTAQILGAVLVTLIIVVISWKTPGKAVSMIGKMTKLTNGVRKFGKMAAMADKFSRATAISTKVGTYGGIIAGFAGGVTGGVAGYYQGQSLNDQADAKELAKFIAKMQQQMDDEQDTIQNLVEQLQSGVAIVMDIMKSESETKNQISRYTSV
jgi:hypothetical protein